MVWYDRDMKKLLALLLLSPLVNSETYSCSNEISDAEPFYKQVIYERKDDYFISISDNLYSFRNPTLFPKSEFEWDIYAEDRRGIILITQGGQLKKDIEDIHTMFIRVVIIDKINQVFQEYDLNQKLLITPTDKARGRCLISKRDN